jgi:hypothetical protein
LFADVVVRFLESLDIVTVDESLIEYQPSKNAKNAASSKDFEPIPTLYVHALKASSQWIDHLQCLYLCCTSLGSLKEFAIDCGYDLPLAKRGDVSPTVAVQKVMER